MTAWRRWLVLLWAVLVVAADAHAVRFRRPYAPDVGLSAAFDNNRGTGLRDYDCNSHTYENHSGTDFRIYFTPVVALAAGTVTQAFNGCDNYGRLGNTCGGGCGNHVHMRFADGSVAYYCHMKRDSIVVSRGQTVTCGQKLGVSASSGNSSGPHLHISLLVGGAKRDLYAGNCSNSGGKWTRQRGYLRAPGTECAVTCQCTAGQVQREACGRCGERTRRCGSDCQWGAWGSCSGAGPCSPGEVQTEDCCDCGQRSRTCDSTCQWNDWGSCGGPDPVEPVDCDTGELGACADGQARCIGGCLSCVRQVGPKPELCDGLDNDCDGPVDEDQPRELGPVPPPFAAQVVDVSLPRTLPAGVSAEGWVAFRNVGADPWQPRALYLRAEATLEGRPSRLAPDVGWPAHDIPAVLEEQVPPGGVTVLRFPLRAREPGSNDPVDIDESFSLIAPTGAAIACPEGGFGLAIASTGQMARSDGRQDDRLDISGTGVPPDSGCTSTLPGAAWAVSTLCLTVPKLRRRRRPPESARTTVNPADC